MKLVQIFVPLTDIDGSRFPKSYFQQLRSARNEKFGGVTIYKQTPVEGFWKETEEKIEKDWRQTTRLADKALGSDRHLTGNR